MTWVSLIAGAYFALLLTMVGTAAAYARQAIKSRKTVDIATLTLMCGIAITFTGHGLDQLLWTASNLDRAHGGQSLRLSEWYASEIPFIVIFGKFIASSGAFLHLWVAFHSKRSIKRTFVSYSTMWATVAITVAVLVS